MSFSLVDMNLECVLAKVYKVIRCKYARIDGTETKD